MAAAELPIDGSSLIEPASYAENGFPHPECAKTPVAFDQI